MHALLPSFQNAVISFLTLKNVKTVLWFRRVFVFFCMICCTVFVYGKGSKWTATYQVDVDNSRSTGSGLVYMTAGSYANTTSPNDFAVIGDVNSSEILVTPSGILILSRLLQLRNAPFPIEVTLLPIVTFVSEMQ